MNDIYDLTNVLPMDTFPWDDVMQAISKSVKKASIFYGVTQQQTNLTPEESTWYTALRDGTVLKGLDILLTRPKDLTQWNQAWYKLGQADFWTPYNDNMRHYDKLQQWIKDADIFSETGRQIVFIQLQNTATPPHVDQDPSRAPEGYRDPTEFIWITPKNGKQLMVNNKPAPQACWFNSYINHCTLPAEGIRWSLRIDGKFTEEFKHKLNTL